jgi:mannose-6-phosphate isomerase-like protein (cupin superfamily)
MAGGHAQAAAPMMHSDTFGNLKGEVALDNERVLVERYLVAPGQSTGAEHSSLDQLWVFVKGGVLRTQERSTLWKDGRVQWHPAGERAAWGSTNVGASTIEIVCVSLKPAAQSANPTFRHLNYPNIAGEDLLENDAVIVQRFNVAPGQWEGVHAHHPNMLWIHVRGGQWAARSKSEAEHAYPQRSADGSVGWMAPVELDVGHESGNIGADPIDLIWVTLKK